MSPVCSKPPTGAISSAVTMLSLTCLLCPLQASDSGLLALLQSTKDAPTLIPLTLSFPLPGKFCPQISLGFTPFLPSSLCLNHIFRQAFPNLCKKGFPSPSTSFTFLWPSLSTLMAEKEELKSLLVKVKEESWKAGLKFNIQKLKTWHLVPSRHCKEMGKQWKQWQILFS